MAAPASFEGGGAKGGQDFFMGAKIGYLSIFMLKSSFGLILTQLSSFGGQTGGQENIFGRKCPHAPYGAATVFQTIIMQNCDF